MQGDPEAEAGRRWWEESGANISGSERGRAAIRRKLSFVSAAARRTTCFIKSFVGKVRTGNDYSYSENMLP